MLNRSVVRTLGLGVIALAAIGGPGGRGAAAEPISPDASGRRVVVPMAVEQLGRPADPISPTLFLQRCTGSCLVTGGNLNDASVLASSIAKAGQYRIDEFANTEGEIGAAADLEWAQLVDCMKKVYSPYAVKVTDVKPTAGTYHVAIVAGRPTNLDLAGDILGIAPLARDCSPQDNVMSFSFANAHMQTDPEDRTSNLCWTAAQESAHAFGLDHQFNFTDGSSACNDPMTYRNDCGGVKYFRNRAAVCGENAPRPCRCGPTQNSHRKLVEVFGVGTPLTALPTITMTTPTVNGEPLGEEVAGSAFSERGIDKVALVLNGYAWVVARGAAFGVDGQPPSNYGLVVPNEVPGGNYDIVLRAFDDIGGATDSQLLTAVKGAPCESADSCLEFQKCEAGKCFWDPPVGELGDDCSYKQFCKSDLCGGAGDRSICTQTCGADDELCPAGFDCVDGTCYFADGGCCSVSNRSPLRVVGHGAFAAVLLGFIVRRRRSRRS